MLERTFLFELPSPTPSSRLSFLLALFRSFSFALFLCSLSFAFFFARFLSRRFTSLARSLAFSFSKSSCLSSSASSISSAPSASIFLFLLPDGPSSSSSELATMSGTFTPPTGLIASTKPSNSRARIHSMTFLTLSSTDIKPDRLSCLRR